MLVGDNEFGAPWNDQFYRAIVEDESGECWEEMLILSGPKEYYYEELVEAAQSMFPYYNIKNIIEDAICG